jgi:hypothetical protein
LNVIIKKNKYSISLIAEIIARLSKIKWMTKIDIRHAFNRIRMHFKKNENLITFRIKYETYKYLIMFFELINESSTFQNFMNDILMNDLDEFVITYLNNIIVYSNSQKNTLNTYERYYSDYEKQKFKLMLINANFTSLKRNFLKW